MMKKHSPVFRKSFGLKEEIQSELESSYHSPLIEKIKTSGYRLAEGRVTVRLAGEFGFCYGVDRAIDYAYQTKAKFPGRRIFLTNEIIHNPQVNTKLCEMGMEFLSGPYAGRFTISDVHSGDVVIIPAFGVPHREWEELQKRGCTLVDTTCGSVMSVWKRVESYSRDGLTSVIHGKYDHEETQATCSRAVRYPRGKYLVVRDKKQTRVVCDYIRGKGNRPGFLKEFKDATSKGFDPDEDLQSIGCANQTTMLSGESIEIADMLRDVLKARYGEEALPSRFRHFDTICSATQDRQDAVRKLVQGGVGLMIVVGGFNSSNTAHLAEISARFCPAYHIDGAACILSADRIRHRKIFDGEMEESDGWLPSGDVTVGITAGASTPNRMIEEVIRQILKAAST